MCDIAGYDFDNLNHSMRKIVVIAFLALWSCGEERLESVKMIDLGAVEKVSADLLIEKAVPLESDATPLLSEYLNVMYDEEGFFVANINSPKGIYHFSNKGEYLGIIAEVGEAPGQITGISEFRFVGDELKVNTGMGNSLQVHTFKKSGELVGSLPIELNASTFYVMPSGEMWFYSSYNMVAGDHRLFITDAGGEVKKQMLFNDFNEKMLVIDEPSFFEGDESVLFREPFKTSVYELSEGDSLRELYRFDFGATTVPEEYWDLEGFAGFEMIDKRGFSDIYHLFESGKYLVAEIMTQQELYKKRELFIWNKKSRKEFKIEIDEDEQGYFQSPIGIEGDQLVFIAYAPYLVRYKENLNFSDEAKSSLAKLTEDSNPVIIYAKIPE